MVLKEKKLCSVISNEKSDFITLYYDDFTSLIYYMLQVSVKYL